MNATCPMMSPFSTPCTCPFRIRFILSYPCKVFQAVSKEKKSIPDHFLHHRADHVWVVSMICTMISKMISHAVLSCDSRQLYLAYTPWRWIVASALMPGSSMKPGLPSSSIFTGMRWLTLVKLPLALSSVGSNENCSAAAPTIWLT